MTENAPTELTLQRFVNPAEEGQYLLLPFEMPPDTAHFTLRYTYPRDHTGMASAETGTFQTHERVNIIDLGLIGPDGRQVGASGSGISEVQISANAATRGYHPTPLQAGTWQIILGAYNVAPEGVNVEYSLSFEPKKARWLQGDLHTHTNASDGIHSLEHLVQHARDRNLDFIGITDHNQPINRAGLPRLPGLTVIPGLEWTHYRGHSNFLGVEAPYTGSFISNTLEEAAEKFRQARENGALIVLNHPFEERYGFKFGFESLPFDLIEIWNGPMRPANLQALGFWDAQLKAGRKLLAVCGSDYHADTAFEQLAGPCLNVYAPSEAEADILAAVKAGNSYFTYQPDTLRLEMSAGGQCLGSSQPWQTGLMLDIRVERLQPGDEIRLITTQGTRALAIAPAPAAETMLSFKSNYQASLPVEQPGYARLEVWRSFFPGIPLLPALLSNPIFFD